MSLTITIQIIKEPVYFEAKSGVKILSVICNTEDSDIIEMIAFNENAMKYRSYFQSKRVYRLRKVLLIDNKKYKKTSNAFKLQIQDITVVNKLTNMIYKKNGVIYVKVNDNEEIMKKKQLSITNYFSKN